MDKSEKEDLHWWVYMVQCADGSLYTGCTNDLAQRIEVHNSGKGAKYTRARLPVKLVYQEEAADRSAAQKREAELKKLKRGEKQQLIFTLQQSPKLG